MSLQLAARHLAQQGRGNDTALVHMAPKELASLQALAQKHGGSLSINPQTGLPEAGFLESLLPAVIGGGLSVMSGGAIDPMTAAMLVGGGQAMMTGDLNKGLMAGIGAYGGAGMGQYMANAGSVMPAAKDVVIQPTAAEIAPMREIPTNVESALGTGGVRPEDIAYGQNGPTGFQFSNKVGNVEQDIAGGNDLMRTNPNLDAYMRKNMPIGEDTYPAYKGQAAGYDSYSSTGGPARYPTVAQQNDFVNPNYSPATPNQIGNYPGGSTAPTVMNTPKDFAAFQRGFTGENALGFMKASPMQAAALASGPLMDATTHAPPAPVVDSNKGANANAGITYHPNWNNPTPAPNRYGMEQVYNRPTYMAEGGQVEHYVSGGLTPALRAYQQLQQQRAGRGSQIDTRQQFEDYMKSVRGGTTKPRLWTPPPTPTPTPIAPTQPIDTSTPGGGGSGRTPADYSAAGEFNPTSQGAYNVSQLGQNISTVSPFLGGAVGAYGNYLAKNVDPNYGHEAKHSLNTPTEPAGYTSSQFSASPPEGYTSSQFSAGEPAGYTSSQFSGVNTPYSAGDEADRTFAAPENNQNYTQGLAMQQGIAANPFSPQDANKALREAMYKVNPRVTTTPEAQQAAIDSLTSDNFYAAKPDDTPESLQQADNALSARLLAAYPADVADKQAADFQMSAPMREYNAALMAKLNKEAEARQNAALSSDFNKIAETPALREQYNRLNLGFQTDEANNAEPGDRYAPVSSDYKTPAQAALEAQTLAQQVQEAQTSAQYTDPFTGEYKAPYVNYPTAGDNLLAGTVIPVAKEAAAVTEPTQEAVSVTEPTQGAYVPNAPGTDPFAPPTATPTGTYYDNSKAGDKGFDATGGWGNVWRSEDGTPITTGDGSSLQTGQGAAQESSNDKVNRIIREAQIAAGEGTFTGGGTEGGGTEGGASANTGFSNAQFGGVPAANPMGSDPAQAAAAAAAAAAQTGGESADGGEGGGGEGGGGGGEGGGGGGEGGGGGGEGGGGGGEGGGEHGGGGEGGGGGGGGGAHGGYYHNGHFNYRMAHGGNVHGAMRPPPAFFQNGKYSFHPAQMYADGGVSDPFNLGSYSDGGRLLKGPGDGVSDSIPATIGKGQPARLADGEFVIPARIVSEIGNGSTDAGARKLYAMMDRIQASRKKTVGKGKVAKNTRADKYLPR